jgi:hypothetical protein
MRITLDLDEDLIRAAREVARRRGVTLGRVIVDLARESLKAKSSEKLRISVPLFEPRSGTRKPRPKLVNELRDEP